MTHPTPADALWLIGTTFFTLLVLAGVGVPLWAALFVRITETSTRLERALVRFGYGLFVVAMVVVGGLAIGLGVTVFARVWRIV